MRADAPLDYAIFQLTPTRTRCELLIAAQGSTYKLASGLLKPFISHLKSAEEQLARGGYSIRLEPPDPRRTLWFTRRTMERFVRFVSTPEILERVSSVEAELIELEETARQQAEETNESTGQVDDQASKSLSVGGKSTAIVIFDKSGKASTENTENGTEESSKQRLLRALDARRVMLQKEQGMAFARALAAGYSIEDMGDLVLFAECFGANRLREACIKFVALCKKRQEAGLAIEDIDLVAAQSEMSYIPIALDNSSGINLNLTSDNGTEATRDYTGDVATARGSSFVQGTPVMAPWQGQAQGQYMPNVLPHTHYGAMHPSAYGVAGQGQPGQSGLPYPPYPYMPVPYPDGNGWQMPPPYWPPNQAREPSDGSHPYGDKSQRDKDSHDRAYNSTAEQHYDSDEAMYQSHGDETRRSSRRSSSRRRQSASPMRRVQIGRSGGGRRSGMVVIRNINYIAPKSQNQDGDEDDQSNSSPSQSEEDDNEVKSDTLRSSVDDAVSVFENIKPSGKDGKRKSSKKGKKKARSKDVTSKRDAGSSDDDAEVGNSHGEKDGIADQSQLKRENSHVEDGLLFVERGRHGISNDVSLGAAELEYGLKTQLQILGVQKENETGVTSVEDTVLLHQREGHMGRSDLHSFDAYAEQRKDSARTPIVDDSFIVVDSRGTNNKRETTTIDSDFGFSAKPSNQPTVDDSFIFVDRSTVRESTNHDSRMPLDLEAEMPSEVPYEQNHDPDGGDSDQEHDYYEPDDLFMVPERNKDSYNRAWDTVDYDMEVLAANMIENGNHNHEQADDEDEDAPVENGAQEENQNVVENAKKTGPKVLDAKAKAMLERRKSLGGRPGRPNPLVEAQLRADKLRAYKAGLQKSKKEKEEEDRKRIEDLKRQRQERIAARSGAAGSPTTSTLRTAGKATPGKPSPKASPRTTPRPSVLSPTLSAVSPTVSKEKTVNSNRIARLAMPSPRLVDNSVTRSVSSITELHKETRKSTPTVAGVRSSTGSHLSLQKPKRADTVSDPKSNIHIDVKEKVGRVNEKLGRTDSGVIGDSVVRKSATVVKSEAQAVVAKTVKDPSLAVSSPKVHVVETKAQAVSSPKVNAVEVKVVKKPSTSISPAPVAEKKPTATVEKPVSSEKVTPKAIISEKVAPKGITSQKVVPKKSLLTQQNVEIKTEKLETALKISTAEATPQINIEANTTNGDAARHVDVTVPSSVIEHHSNLPVESLKERNDVSIPSEAAVVVNYASHVQTDSIEGSDGVLIETEAGSSAGEDCHAPISHVSSSEDNSISVKDSRPVYTDLKTPAQGLYSPPFAPPSEEYVVSPSTNAPHSSDFNEEEPSPDSNLGGTSTTRSRKKWGDSKAKGLKKLLLLGRKSSRSSAQSPSDIVSDGEEEDSSLSTGKSLNPPVESDGFDEQAATKLDAGSGSSSSKGSRSFFSLSTLRGKSTVKT